MKTKIKCLVYSACHGHSVDENMAVIILSSHTHAIVFWLAEVSLGQQLCEIACKVCHHESD